MKRIFLFCVILWGVISVYAQDNKSADFTGNYQVEYYPARKLNIYRENKNLMVEIVGQGKTGLTPLTANTFSVNGLSHSTIEFIQDSQGNTIKFKLILKVPGAEWNKISQDSGVLNDSPESLQRYEGRYAQKGNSYQVIDIKVNSGHLTSQIPGETVLDYYPLSQDKFIFKKDDFNSVLEFTQDKKGHINRLHSTDSGPIVCVKATDKATGVSSAKHNFTLRTDFTEADTLRGKLSSLRTCFDVLFYDLNVKVNPDSKSILGNTIIRFRSVNDFKLIQIDLFANMKIEKIVFHDTTLSYTRKQDAVFVQFPKLIKQGSEEEIHIYYSGIPQIPDLPSLSGGFIWTQDKNGKPWIETVVQGSGASLWWPCKDHLSDKPDSMHITVIVPTGLTVISNGKLIGKSDLPDKQTQFKWAVSYPMNNYSAVLYIGDYVHFSDQFVSSIENFPLNYYCLSYHLDLDKQFVRRVKPLLELYEKDFGPYPFPRDGYALVESPYGMEHQSAVSSGTFTNLSDDKPVDSIAHVIEFWHETAHEWWGNSVTCNDMADFWIHESFASYAEVLCYESFFGRSAAEEYLTKQDPGNKEPIIGFYDVNDFHMGDMYSKGMRMIATLRNVINNDSIFFDLLRSIQSKFKYRSINTTDIVSFINAKTGTDYTYLFDQYLRYPAIPKLIVSMKKTGEDLVLQFKWNANVSNFVLPVKISTPNKKEFFIYPATEWKSILMPKTSSKDIRIDNQFSYFDIEKTE
jgi:Peptidase family M1 domain/Peptidase M1 N-terminal domain